MGTILHRAPVRLGFLGGVVLLLVASASLVFMGFVKVKMLPFDNKSESQVIVDMPSGTALEETERVTRELARATLGQPEVTSVQTYSGATSP
jgi:multidrug efflux pump subunit AcrB